MANPFSDESMAAGYAFARPPVHPLVVGLLREWIGSGRVNVAADLGCGAGLSTRPLLELARTCIGFDPAESMVRAARRVVPEAALITAAAEHIPLASGSVDLLAAAGSLNYARDLDAVWPEAVRVLSRTGILAVYDFSAGRSLADTGDRGDAGDTGDASLDTWFEAFRARYPAPASQAIPLSPSILSARATGFRMTRGEAFAVPIALTPEFYTDYLLTETNVQAATERGTPIDDIRAWIASTVGPVFGGRARPVVFRGYLATLAPAGR